MKTIVIIKNKKGNFLPKNDKDLPIFKHCFEGFIEVKPWKFNENEFLLLGHGYKYIIEEESQ